MKRLVRVFVLFRHVPYEKDTVAQVFADESAADAKAKEMNRRECEPGIDWIVEQHPVAYTTSETASDALLAIEDVLDEMSRIISEHPAAMEYETDARDTWPTRWGTLLGYLKAKRDIANAAADLRRKENHDY